MKHLYELYGSLPNSEGLRKLAVSASGKARCFGYFLCKKSTIIHLISSYGRKIPLTLIKARHKMTT